MPAPVANANIARHLTLMAERRPEQAALKIPRGRTSSGDIDYLSLTFRELAAEVDAWRAHLGERDVRRGDRTLVMVQPGLPLIASVFALFQLGAVPVVIDPGMGLKNFLACVSRTQPRVLLGIPSAQIASHLFRRAFRPVEIRVRASSSPVARRARGRSVPGSEKAEAQSEIVASAASDLAAILFTSGSTGAPKGVCYEHGMFEAQVNLIRDTYGIEPGEVDLPMLPIFALFNPALGMTTVVPEMDPRRPAAVDPARIVQAIRQERVTNSFGSPLPGTPDHSADPAPGAVRRGAGAGGVVDSIERLAHARSVAESLRGHGGASGQFDHGERSRCLLGARSVRGPPAAWHRRQDRRDHGRAHRDPGRCPGTGDR